MAKVTRNTPLGRNLNDLLGEDTPCLLYTSDAADE